MNESDKRPDADVLIVGAGPTGLTLAAQLSLFGVRARIIDRLTDRARESRALAIQPRTLEVLDGLGIAETLVERGNRSARLQLHFDRKTIVRVALDDIGMTDTRFPFLLFLSQAETEAILGEYLEKNGITVERGVELTAVTGDPDGVTCTLQTQAGANETFRARYVAGCDGAHSTVRSLAAIPFEGGSYPQQFLLADVEIDGPLEKDTIHSFVGSAGSLMVFPLGRPRSWRVIGMQSRTNAARNDELTLDELRAFAGSMTEGLLSPHDPAWLTWFRLHHRQAARYRAGRLFLAGDAAHIHSPAGAQGMNTGIQDAWNLGWKLALVIRGAANEELLDTYEAERWPIGRFLLKYTDRLFALFARGISANRAARVVRKVMGRWVLPRVVAKRRVRTVVFRTISQLAIRYRNSPAVAEGQTKVRGGPRAGDRLPDVRVMRGSERLSLHQIIGARHVTLILAGGDGAWNEEQIAELKEAYSGLLAICRVTESGSADALTDMDRVLIGSDPRRAAHYLVRPDAHIAFRAAGTQLDELSRYMARWFRRSAGYRAVTHS